MSLSITSDSEEPRCASCTGPCHVIMATGFEVEGREQVGRNQRAAEARGRQTRRGKGHGDKAREVVVEAGGAFKMESLST